MIQPREYSRFLERDQFFGHNKSKWKEIQICILHEWKLIKLRMTMPENLFQSEGLQKRHQLVMRHMI